MNEIERRVCAELGLEPREYWRAAHARRSGRPGSLSVNRGGFGQANADRGVDEAEAEMLASGELPAPDDDRVDARALAIEARHAVEAFLADGDPAHLTRAGAFNRAALARSLPNYAERHFGRPSDDGDDDADGAESRHLRPLGDPFATSASARRGQVAVMVRSLPGGPREVRLDRNEVAIANKLGISLEAFAAQRARRRLGIGA